MSLSSTAQIESQFCICTYLLAAERLTKKAFRCFFCLGRLREFRNRRAMPWDKFMERSGVNLSCSGKKAAARRAHLRSKCTEGVEGRIPSQAVWAEAQTLLASLMLSTCDDDESMSNIRLFDNELYITQQNDLEQFRDLLMEKTEGTVVFTITQNRLTSHVSNIDYLILLHEFTQSEEDNLIKEIQTNSSKDFEVYKLY